MIAELKATILAALSRQGAAKFDGHLTDSAVRAVAELISEGKCYDTYEDGALKLVITRKGIGE